MATAQITEIIDCTTRLRNSCRDLKKDLSVLDTYIKSQDDIIVITYDESGVINVYATNKLKAYIPKKYNGFIVNFTEAASIEAIKFDLKEEILV